MDIDYRFFVSHRANNAAWNLLCANNAPVILTFVHEAYIKQSRTSAPESELVEILKDIIFTINGGYLNVESSSLDNSNFYQEYLEESGADVDSVPQEASAGSEGFDGSANGAMQSAMLSAQKIAERKKKEEERLNSAELKDDPIYYLRQWSSESLRYFYCEYDGQTGTEPLYKITPELQKAYSFVVSMNEYSNNFVPTESRFKEILEILKEVHMSTEGNAQMYLDDLLAQRAALDEKIEKAKKGEVISLSDSQIRERFLQFQHDAIELLDDFRQVDANLCNLDKEIMQDILNWTGPRGELLDKYFDQNEYIENTDQGRSVKAFSRLLLSSSDDELIMTRIDNLINHKAVASLHKDERIHNIHDSWLNARLNIERIMGASTKRIKSFLQPANLDANRFLKERIKSITQKVSDLTKEDGLEVLPPELFELEIPRAEINLPYDRPLASVSDRLEFNTEIKKDEFKADDHKLFDQVVVNPELLASRISEFMDNADEVDLYDIVQKYPLDHGITELTTYVKLAMLGFDLIEDPDRYDLYRWEALDPDGNRVARVAKLKHLTLKRR
ncbi:DUF3375 domain-containing protein [Anaerobiospirillum sp. NML120448]|uniref:DUF3375 family protein n=1 Tax=Anaerobiospirillum sp. NML120448 TaxID=2932816 RepID=UPI001FF5C22D|nr:DUF3375 family protein [Anaerobiospirillum sp. NML120448]MCK0513483.1 DUF3375 domain-containing protein [Anaerobiospirillum sp. NML120448]